MNAKWANEIRLANYNDILIQRLCLEPMALSVRGLWDMLSSALDPLCLA